MGCDVEMRLHNGTHFIEFWDIGGQPKFEMSRKVFYSKASAIIFVFDVTNRRSYLNLRAWIQEIDLSNRTDGRLEESFLHTASATLEALHHASQQQRKVVPRLLAASPSSDATQKHGTYSRASFFDQDEQEESLVESLKSLPSILLKPRLWIRNLRRLFDGGSNGGGNEGGLLTSLQGRGSPENDQELEEQLFLNPARYKESNSATAALSETSDTDIESAVSLSTLVTDPSLLGGLPVLIVGNKVDLLAQQPQVFNLNIPTQTSNGASSTTAPPSTASTTRRGRALSEARAPLSMLLPALHGKYRARTDFGYPVTFAAASKSTPDFTALLDPINAFISAVIARHTMITQHVELSNRAPSIAAPMPVALPSSSYAASNPPSAIAAPSGASSTGMYSTAANIMTAKGTTFLDSSHLASAVSVPPAQIPSDSGVSRPQYAPAAAAAMTTPSAPHAPYSTPTPAIPVLPPLAAIDSSQALAALEAESRKLSQGFTQPAQTMYETTYRPGQISSMLTTPSPFSMPLTTSGMMMRDPAVFPSAQDGNYENIPTLSLDAFMNHSGGHVNK